VQHKKMKNS